MFVATCFSQFNYISYVWLAVSWNDSSYVLGWNLLQCNVMLLSVICYFLVCFSCSGAVLKVRVRLIKFYAELAEQHHSPLCKFFIASGGKNGVISQLFWNLNILILKKNSCISYLLTRFWVIKVASIFWYFWVSLNLFKFWNSI